MGSLTHVCVWFSKGWTHIAPEEVARSHPGESVSARSGLFMCELCGQYAKSYAVQKILNQRDFKFEMPFSLHEFPAPFQRRFPALLIRFMAGYPMQTVIRFSRFDEGL